MSIKNERKEKAYLDIVMEETFFDLQTLFSIIASILHLGNVNFVEDDGKLVLDDNGSAHKVASVSKVFGNFMNKNYLTVIFA